METKEERKTRGRKREEDDMERDYADTSRDKVVNINTTTQLQAVSYTHLIWRPSAPWAFGAKPWRPSPP